MDSDAEAMRQRVIKDKQGVNSDTLLPLGEQVKDTGREEGEEKNG